MSTKKEKCCNKCRELCERYSNIRIICPNGCHSIPNESIEWEKEAVKKMVDRFLGWKLPEDFNPDGGISFEKTSGIYRYERIPVGTNLFTATQAEEMVRYILGDTIASAVEAREREISEAVDIVGIDCGCVLGKCEMCASIDFIKSEILSFITTAVAKRELDIADEVEKIKTYTGGSSVNEKDKRVNKAEVLSILKH